MLNFLKMYILGGLIVAVSFLNSPEPPEMRLAMSIVWPLTIGFAVNVVWKEIKEGR